MVAYFWGNWSLDNQIQTQVRRLFQLPRPQHSVISRLGFIYADGSLRNNSLRFGLVTEGREHLQKLASALRFTGTVRVHSNTRRCDLDLTHPKFAIDLRTKGVVERKTWCVAYPSFLPQHLDRHFIRGVFDGDGSITTGTTRYRGRVYMTPCMSICGAVPKFLQAIVSRLTSNAGTAPVKVIRRRLRGVETGTWTFSYSGTPALRVRDYLYGKGGPWMDCKRDRFYSFEYASKRPRDKEHQTEIVRQLVAARGGTLLTVYSGYHQPITVQCQVGHTWATRVRTLKDGAWCPKSAHAAAGLRKFKQGKETLQTWLEAKRWGLLSKYRGDDYEVTLLCEHGKPFHMKAKSVKYEHARCDCVSKNTLAYGRLQLLSLLTIKKWELVSEYQGGFEYVTLKCQHGKCFQRLPANLKLRSKCQCQKCASSGTPGVYATRNGKWQVRIRKNGGEVLIGTFRSKKAAETARGTALRHG